MRQRVELVGRAWRCGRGGPWSFDAGHEYGADRVGGRWVAWARSGPDAVGVAHEGARGLLDPVLALVARTTPAREQYVVRLARIGSGRGTRFAWSCPSCGRACGLLYLPPSRQRLACRRCCALVYSSQYRPAKRRLRY